MLVPLVLPSNDDDCGLASGIDDVLLSSVTIRGNERWGSPYHPSWATDPAGPWLPAYPGEPTHPGRRRPKWRFPLSFPGYLQKGPEGRGRRWGPSAKGPCHPWHTTVSWSQRAWGGARECGYCPVSQMWQWKDDCGCRKRFFAGQYSFLKERRESHLFPHLAPGCVSYFLLALSLLNSGDLILFSQLDGLISPWLWFLLRSCCSQLRGGSRSMCVNILVLNFQGQQTQSLVGWEEASREGECRPPATNTVWEDQGKWEDWENMFPVCCRTACEPPFTFLVVVVSGQQLLRNRAHPVGSYLQGQDEWHPLHFGVSPEWLWYSAPAVSPRWCGLL